MIWKEKILNIKKKLNEMINLKNIINKNIAIIIITKMNNIRGIITKKSKINKLNINIFLKKIQNKNNRIKKKK